MSKYAISGLLLIVAFTSGYLYGRSDGTDIERAKQLELEVVARVSRDAALRTAADAIARIEVKHVTIRQEIQREIYEKPVYRECVHSPDGLRLLNDALRGPFAPGIERLHPAD